MGNAVLGRDFEHHPLVCYNIKKGPTDWLARGYPSFGFRLRGRLNPSLKGALGKVDLLTASGALVGFVEFIGKDFLFLTTRRAFACEGFKAFELFVSRAMLGCRRHCHSSFKFEFPAAARLRASSAPQPNASPKSCSAGLIKILIKTVTRF
jgi:hypothetical protein